jgi:hypothetical protein
MGSREAETTRAAGDERDLSCKRVHAMFLLGLLHFVCSVLG